MQEVNCDHIRTMYRELELQPYACQNVFRNITRVLYSSGVQSRAKCTNYYY